jgi:selenocysteine lyase/cysteine desulfurase
VTHLDNAGAALPPAVVSDTVIDHLRVEASRGGYRAAAEAAPRLAAVRDSLATLINPREYAQFDLATHELPDPFRASVHYYNTSQELRRLVEAVDGLRD